MITLLPLLVIMFAYGCDQHGGYNPFQRFYNFATNFDIEYLKHQISNWSYGSAIFYLGIVLQLVVYSCVLPGEEIEGAPLRDGTRLKYKINGKLCWVCVYTMYSYVRKKKSYGCTSVSRYSFFHVASWTGLGHVLVGKGTLCRYCLILHFCFLLCLHLGLSP